MNKQTFFLLLCLWGSSLFAQNWISKTTQVRFFSSTPLEDIDAKTQTAVAALSQSTGKVIVKIQIKSFNFPKKLMQEHFNENYLESDKYPASEFEGTFSPMPDFSKIGSQQAKVKGTMTIHGVKKEVELPVSLNIQKNNIEASSIFKVRCSDFNIQIPKLVVKNIAEEIEVTINANFKPVK